MHRFHSYLNKTLHGHVGLHSKNKWITSVLPSCSVCQFSNSTVNQGRVPSEARVVICGGGVIGASVAYHLAERGWTDVAILEQGR